MGRTRRVHLGIGRARVQGRGPLVLGDPRSAFSRTALSTPSHVRWRPCSSSPSKPLSPSSRARPSPRPAPHGVDSEQPSAQPRRHNSIPGWLVALRMPIFATPTIEHRRTPPRCLQPRALPLPGRAPPVRVSGHDAGDGGPLRDVPVPARRWQSSRLGRQDPRRATSTHLPARPDQSRSTAVSAGRKC